MQHRLFAVRNRYFVTLTVAVVVVVLAWRQHAFVDRYAVNVMFWDQWDFYTPLFQNGSLWDIFNYQHGPHRQGIGFILTSILAELSGWNSRWDAFGVSFVIIAAAALGLWLAYNCGVRGFALLPIPLIFLNIRQYEMLVGPSNISHGAMPVLLFIGLCLTWYLPSHGLRLTLICFLTFFLIFTGFGLFVGIVVPMVLLLQAFQYVRDKAIKEAVGVGLALVGITAAWGLFASGYCFQPAVENFRFPYEKPQEYFFFVASMLNNFHGIRGHGVFAMTLGFVTVSALALITWKSGEQLLRKSVLGERRHLVIFSLAAFALIYCFETAVGRVFCGWKGGAAASRYVTLMIPAGLALYLFFAGLKNRVLSISCCFLYAVSLIFGTLRLHNSDWRFIHSYRTGRLAWKAVYLATGDEGKAGELAGFQIYPAVQLQERLHFLEKHQLNLFNPRGLP